MSSQPRWKNKVEVEEKGLNFLRSNQRLQSILQTWSGGYEFTNERLAEFAKEASIIYESVYEIANKSGVVEQ